MLRNIFKSFIREEKGQTLVEWIVILALILIVIIGILTAIGKAGSKKAQDIQKSLE